MSSKEVKTLTLGQKCGDGHCHHHHLLVHHNHHHHFTITKNDQPITFRIKCWISAFGDNPFTIIIIAVVVILDAVFVLMMITIMRRAGKNDQPINSRIKCWINAFGDNPLQQSAIKSLKHSFHRTAQENDRDTHARVTIRICGLFAKCIVFLKQVDIFGTLAHTC